MVNKGIHPDGYPIRAARDRVTQADMSISSDHANIHAGTGFSVSLLSAGVANNGIVGIQITTPAGKYVHLKRYEVAISGSQAKLEIIEAPTISGGATLTAINRRRVGTPTACGCTIKGTPTSQSEGTTLETLIFGGGGVGASAPSGSRSLDIEFVLKPSTTYYLKATNTSGSTEDVGMWLFWYEEDDG